MEDQATATPPTEAPESSQEDSKVLKALRAEREARKAAEKELKALNKQFEQRLAKAVEKASLEAANVLQQQHQKHQAELQNQQHQLDEARVNAELARVARKAGLSDSAEAEAHLIGQLRSSKLAVAPDEISGREDIIFGPDGKAVLDGSGNELSLGGWLEQQRADSSWDAYLAAPKGASPSAPQAPIKAPVTTLQAMQAGLEAGQVTTDQLFAAAFGGGAQ